MPSDSEFVEGNLTISSTDNSVATIILNYIENGVADFSITPLTAGTSTITATYETASDTLTSSFDLEITAPSMEWNSSSMTFVSGNTYENEITLHNIEDYDPQDITVTSSSQNITITRDSTNPLLFNFGTIYSQEDMTATITATYHDLSETFTIAVYRLGSFSASQQNNNYNYGVSFDITLSKSSYFTHTELIYVENPYEEYVTVTRDSQNPLLYHVTSSTDHFLGGRFEIHFCVGDTPKNNSWSYGRAWAYVTLLPIYTWQESTMSGNNNQTLKNYFSVVPTDTPTANTQFTSSNSSLTVINSYASSYYITVWLRNIAESTTLTITGKGQNNATFTFNINAIP